MLSMDELYHFFAPKIYNMSEKELPYLNTSEHEFPNDLWIVRSPKEIAIKTTLMLPLGIGGLFLNYAILSMLYKNRWLWSPSNILVGNLALVDFVTLLFCPWLMLVRDFYQNFVLRSFGCRFEAFLQGTCLLAAVGAIMLVSYDRLAAATLTTDARVTKRAAPKLIIISWICAALLSVPWIIFRSYQERQWLDFLETFCAEDRHVLGVYWHVIITILVWVPLGLMIVTYGAILWRLEKSSKDLASRGSGNLIIRARSRAMRVTACVLVTATICRLPYTVLVYWMYDLYHRGEMNAVNGSFDRFWFAANYLMYLDCALNPLIYGFTNERFRRAMDRTPGLSYFKFGTWCCICAPCANQFDITKEKKEKVFIIEDSPKPNKKLSRVIKNIFHINKDTIEFSIPKDDLTNKATKVTPMKTENV